ncbi:MAG TPA: TIR domain-containing protein, partial [Acidimicrobiales bacterium]|nr:TIR domain-containing protein [Acidimicrobiales bacterium]
MRIFLSYRRSDSAGHVGRLSDTLAERLGPDNVFQDVTDIAAGHDFAATIRGALDSADAALAVIGPGWIGASTPDGGRRLLDPGDYVRLELATALQRSLPVVPVLVGGARLPAAGELPDDLRPLLARQATALHDGTWHRDVDHLLRSLRGEPLEPSRRTARRPVVAGLVALGLAAVALWRPWDGGAGDGGDRAEDAEAALSPSCPDPTGSGWTTLAPGAEPTARRSQPGGGEVELTVRATRWRPMGVGRWQVVADTSLGVRGPGP